jgi:hypothetical protein
VRRLWIVVGVVALGSAAVLLFKRMPGHAPGSQSRLAIEQKNIEGVNRSQAPLVAYYKAAPGATPCESCWNGLQAVVAAAQEQHAEPPWQSLYDRDTFMARCNALPAADQKCVAPQYEHAHLDECNPVLERLHYANVLYVGRPRTKRSHP